MDIRDWSRLFDERSRILRDQVLGRKTEDPETAGPAFSPHDDGIFAPALQMNCKFFRVCIKSKARTDPELCRRLTRSSWNLM